MWDAGVEFRRNEEYSMNSWPKYLYRITHIDNIPHIVSNGITLPDSPNSNANYKTIGDRSLINTRKN